MIFGITIAIVFLIGALAMYGSFVYGEMKGYEKGLDSAEQIALEVLAERIAEVIQDERVRGNID